MLIQSFSTYIKSNQIKCRPFLGHPVYFLFLWPGEEMTTVYSTKFVFHETGFLCYIFSTIINRVHGYIVYRINILLMTTDRSG